MQSRNDVAMNEHVGQLDLGAKDLEVAVGTNEPDELDDATPRQGARGREVRDGKARIEGQLGTPLVRGGALEYRVSMVRVVEAFEGARPTAQVSTISEPLAAKEALVRRCR